MIITNEIKNEMIYRYGVGFTDRGKARNISQRDTKKSRTNNPFESWILFFQNKIHYRERIS